MQFSPEEKTLASARYSDISAKQAKRPYRVVYLFIFLLLGIADHWPTPVKKYMMIIIIVEVHLLGNDVTLLLIIVITWTPVNDELSK